MPFILFVLFHSVDSILLLENGFKVTSTDASDKMLKQALKIRWQRRKEKAFDNWGMCHNNTVGVLPVSIWFISCISVYMCALLACVYLLKKLSQY